jgi:AAA+ superfamily predicted ATPase
MTYIDRLNWQSLPSGDAAAFLRIMFGAGVSKALGDIPVVATVAKLPFYSRTELMRLTVGPTEVASVQESIFVLHTDESRLMLLDGGSPQVHDINDYEQLSLDPSQRIDYLRFFNFAVRGTAGAFVLLESLQTDANPTTEEIKEFVSEPKEIGSSDDGSTRIATKVAYDGVAYAATFEVTANGLVQMIDDEPIREMRKGLVPAPPPLRRHHEYLRYLVPAHVPSAEDTPSLNRKLADLVDAAVSAPFAKPDVVQKANETPKASAEQLLVEMLLERALANQKHNRLLGYFNAAKSTVPPLEAFAELMITAYPMVIIESHLPFVEEALCDIITKHRGERSEPIFNISKNEDALGEITVSGYRTGNIIVVPMQSGLKLSNGQKTAYRLANADVSTIFFTDDAASLPTYLHDFTDVSLELPPIDEDMFAVLFEQTMDYDLPVDWQVAPTNWVKYVLPTDFEHPRRMALPATASFEYIRDQVNERLSRVDVKGALSLKDLHGLAEARQFAEDLIADIQAAIAGKLQWTQVDRGALLVGPPGTGKTTLARAIANDCGVRFIQASAAGWMAQGESLGPHIRQIRQTFAEARRYAPAIVFIDEIDSIGSRERFSGQNAQYNTEIVNAVLEQVQALDVSAPVFVIGATNFEERVDPALKRSGRLDRVIRIPLPNKESLTKIYAFYLGAAGEAKFAQSASDMETIAGLSLGLSGADIERMVRGAMRRARKQGRALAVEDLLAEITGKPTSESGTPRLRPEEIERIAWHEAGHALAICLGSSKGEDIGYVSIIPRPDGTLGFVARIPNERVSYTKADYLERLRILLAGRAAEEIHYGAEHVSSGATSDLKTATDIATMMVTRFGMGGSGKMRWVDSAEPGNANEVETLLTTAYSELFAQFRHQEQALKVIAEHLMVAQELQGSELLAMISRETRVF